MAVGTCMNKIVIIVSLFVNIMKGLQLREWGHTIEMVDLLLQKVSAVGALVTPRYSIYVKRSEVGCVSCYGPCVVIVSFCYREVSVAL